MLTAAGVGIQWTGREGLAFPDRCRLVTAIQNQPFELMSATGIIRKRKLPFLLATAPRRLCAHRVH